MRYLIAIILPPVSVLFTGRPLSALLNVLLTACFWLPGVIHAILCLNADEAERRHAELLSATTGKPMPRRESHEKRAFFIGSAAAGLVILLALAFDVANRFIPDLSIRSLDEITADFQRGGDKAPPAPTSKTHARPSLDASLIEGRTFTEIEGLHGPAKSKDKTTGWAEWNGFGARFEGGKAVEVLITP
jgi:uncharacterized membrane protein YqaE (UPF0057 family)